MSTSHTISTLKLYGNDTGKEFAIIADDNFVHFKSEFEKTLIDNVYISHEGEDKNLSTKLTEIQDSVSDEVARATAKEDEIKADLDSQMAAETSARLVKDADLQTQISENKTAAELSIASTQAVLTDLINQETDRAMAKEDSLQASIDSEATRASDAEASLSSRIDSEVSRATTAEQIITASVVTEKNRAMAKEAQLEDRIAAEEIARLAKDAELEARDSEIDIALQNEIDRAKQAESDEVARATAAEASLANALAVETSRAVQKEAQLENTLNNVISNIDPVALDSLTEIVARMNEVDSSAYQRISTIEAYIKQVFDLESLYPLTVTDMAQVTYAISSHAQVFPDEQPPVYCAPGGWGFKNATPGKINWYFASQSTEEHKTLEDYSGFYAKVRLISVASLPFFNIYTKPKGDGTDASSWYGSRRTFVFRSDHGINAGDEVLMYYGADLPATYPDIPHIQLVLDPGSSNGSDDLSQEFQFISFATNSAAAVDSVDLCAKAFIYGDGKHTHIQLYSEPPPPSVNVVINTTPGAYPTELWASITTEPNGLGDVVWSQGVEKYLNPGPITNVVTSLPTGVQLYFNAWDTFGDGWNGATYSVAKEDGTIVSDNDGLSPSESGELAGSFGFQL